MIGVLLLSERMTAKCSNVKFKKMNHNDNFKETEIMEIFYVLKFVNMVI